MDCNDSVQVVEKRKKDIRVNSALQEDPTVSVVTTTQKHKEFPYIFFLETKSFIINGFVSSSDIERIGNRRRHQFFVRYIFSHLASNNEQI